MTINIWNSFKKRQAYIIQRENVLVVTEVREGALVGITIKGLIA